MACAGETAGGVELVEVDTPASPVEHREPDVERQSQSDDYGDNNGGGGFLCQISIVRFTPRS
jgi:hypothetical protein